MTIPFDLPAERRPPGGRHPDAPKGPVPYIATAELIEAVNLAIFLNRPLLLEGEAGSGKSQLARHVADVLGLPFHPTSSSRPTPSGSRRSSPPMRRRGRHRPRPRTPT
ncbi:hypothetical protein [Candidatus Thiodictyon syntrophicum]|jgi:hypothetical protein|uniref:hypothetical protein n=1 Tax=Candidatus Thiodictyon syntrophicum TaxID=1166950 RepID=UPI001C129967|nr:hypothetical protein [Candidatus Thiodictyon syntrophicum]